MKYVYFLRSIKQPDQTYSGLTDDLKQRLKEHNTGKSFHTSKYKPWRILTYLAFSESEKAVAFERYIKTGSGSCTC